MKPPHTASAALQARPTNDGRSTATVQWTDGADLSSYPQAISELVGTEFGFAGVTADGHLLWKRRRWYDPAGTGVAVPAARLTYRATHPDEDTYRADLGQTMSEDRVVNRWIVASSTHSAEPALAEDHDSQTRLGTREDTLSQPWRMSQPGCTQLA